MSNTPFLFIGISFIVSIMKSFGEAFYRRLHQCFFLGASCCSPNFCFSTLR